MLMWMANIGYVMPGKVPIRAGGDGRLPVPGWNDDYHWTGLSLMTSCRASSTRPRASLQRRTIRKFAPRITPICWVWIMIAASGRSASPG